MAESAPTPMSATRSSGEATSLLILKQPAWEAGTLVRLSGSHAGSMTPLFRDRHSAGSATPAHRCEFRRSTQHLGECLRWCLEPEGLSRAFVELLGDGVEVGLGQGLEVQSSGEVLAQQTEPPRV
jgi:hypothetical protein